jgi:hypothetical protein
VLSTRERRYAVTGQPVFRVRLANAALPPGAGSGSGAGAGAGEARTGREWSDQRRK